jgi:tRNA-splicing ligase RtcB
MQWHDNIPVFGEPSDPETLAQARNCLAHEQAVYSGLMADNHRGYSQPIGGVVAYDNAVSPSGVGYDIGCGNNALCTQYDYPQIRNCITEVMDTIWNDVNFGVGSKSDLGKDHPIFNDPRWAINSHVQDLRELARIQIGSVGSGNHYVDLFYDERNRVWIGNHFGSRGFGHKTATGFLNLAQGRAWNGRVNDAMDAPPTVLGLDTDLGKDYWAAMELAGEYALVGRDLVLFQVLDILERVIEGRSVGFVPMEIVRNNHNLAWRESHAGRDLIVVRKGATPAWPGQLGFIGGSMGDHAVIVRGAARSEFQEAALYSTVHGAGRTMSRTQAAGKMNWKTRTRSGGEITPEMMHERVRAAGVVLRGAGTDEAPQAYKHLPDVLAAQLDTIEIVHDLTPIGVAMAGPDIVDPYKD